LTPDRGKTFFLCSKASTLPTGPTRPPVSGHWVSFIRKTGCSVKLTTHIHPVLRLSTSGAVLTLPTYAFMASTGS